MKVGIFWFVENTLVYKFECIQMPRKDSLGLVDSDFKHFEEWELNALYKQFNLNISPSPYHCFPRGRVIFDSGNQFSKVYLDKTIFNSSVKYAIIRRLGLIVQVQSGSQIRIIIASQIFNFRDESFVIKS